MKERPILFNAAMVRAILEGRKTQTAWISKACLQCEKQFEVQPSHQETHFFCSHSCQFKWRSVQNGADRNPNWKGGLSRLPYVFNWADVSRRIRERDGHQCFGLSCSGADQLMCVHHIDYNKANCSDHNLLTLCRSCNSKANFNREDWREKYSELMTVRFGLDARNETVVRP